MKIAINGMGRVGKLLVRALIEGGIDADIALINDREGNAADHAHWLEFDFRAWALVGRYPDCGRDSVAERQNHNGYTCRHHRGLAA